MGRAALLLLLGVLVLPGCASVHPAAHPTEKAPFVYRVGPGDVLTIGVWNEPGLEDREVVVTPAGHISFPLVEGTLDVTDATLAEVAGALRRELKAVLKDPVVTVALMESLSSQIQVLGEVEKQGRVVYRDGMSLIQAIGEAGGPDWATARLVSVHVVRGALTEPTLYVVDVKNLMNGGERDLYLQAGDIVVVPPKYVTRFARYIHQMLAPLAVAAGTAGTAANIGLGGY